ncbi:SIMPL domain-containing protein [Nocardioides sp. CGMCC 1.13656]|nr:MULTISPECIES: SIMPL domain-containing protein [unclassified Nocardioides]MBA2953033.1 SIMPL domain-containing protein [Nocardioides sp. CGMCC 1.13656]
MDRSNTLSTRALLLVVLVAVALVAAYLLGGRGPAAPAAADDQRAPAQAPRELTMTGTGEASAVPDRLGFTAHVHVTRPDLDDALAAANATMARVQAALVEHGVDERDLQTTGLSMDPVYAYHPYDPPTIVGYRVSQRARVLVQPLSEGGAAVGAAVEAGGNDVRVDSLRLLVSDADAVMARARTAAVDEARAKAEEYAAASGQDLGDVLTLREVRAVPVPTPVVPDAALAYRRASDVPIRAGREEGKVTVRIVWALG